MDPSSIQSLNYWIGMAGTVAFAVTAVLAVAPRGTDRSPVLQQQGEKHRPHGLTNFDTSPVGSRAEPGKVATGVYRFSAS